jgi:uncharacterized protein DUF4388
MSVQGNLKTMPLPDVLQWLAQGQKTGTLVIDNGRVEKKIYFRNGAVISSASTDPHEHLGHFLVSHGFISEKQLAEGMLQQSATKVLLGRILVGIKAISETDLRRMLRLKSEESIFESFQWPEGEFRFLEQDLPTTEMVPILLDVTALVMEGSQRVDEWRRIREVIRSKHAVPVTVRSLDDLNLGPGERQMLSLVNDDRTVEEISLQSHASEFFACRILHEYVQSGVLKIVNPRDAASTPADAVKAPSAIDAKVLVEAGRKHLQRGDYESGLRHLWAARSLEPDNAKLKQVLQQAEANVHKLLAEEGIEPSAVPHLARPMDELMKLSLSPQEGFLLTRVDGKYDIQSIQKISPMTGLEAQLVFDKLVKAGHVALKPAPGGAKGKQAS